MSKLIDLAGQRFGRLVVIKKIKRKGGRTMWLCKCDCGNEKQVCSADLRNGETKSCGCLRKEIVSARNKIKMTTHGKSKTKLYNVWFDIKRRCYNSKRESYKHYGLRNIKNVRRMEKMIL